MVKTSLKCASAADLFAIVAAVNDDVCLGRNLAQSNLITEEGVETVYVRGARSASRAYNEGFQRTTADYLVFAHQDVYLPDPFRNQLVAAIDNVTAQDPSWGVIGAYGVDLDGHHNGTVWSSGLGRTLGMSMQMTQRAQSLDELILIVRRASGCRFDPDLPDFHLYGTDIVLTAQSRQSSAWIVELPVVHNSKSIRTLGPGFAAAYHYMRKKWRTELPVQTPVLALTRNSLPLWRTRLNLWRTRARRAARSVSPNTDPRAIARACNYEPVS